MSEHSLAGCGSSACQCTSPVATSNTTMAASIPSINGIALHAAGEQPDVFALRELAYTELLRQQAVQLGLLPRYTGLTTPTLDESQRQVIEAMVEEAATCPTPTEVECKRYFDANAHTFVVGRALHVRHILFAVTPGVNVQALTVHAEKALLSLLGKDVPAERFAQVAAEMSNCPSSTQGGDLGWIGPDDCAPELAQELFDQKHSQSGTGIHPRLIHSRFGFHIIDVLGRRPGIQKTYDEVRERIAAQLTLQSRAKAMHQYMSLLVGEALVEGITLEGADSPLVQ